MKTNWTHVKSIINATERQSGLFLALIDDDGSISCANATMLKSFHLENPRSGNINFFDMVHPIHVADLKKTIHHATQQNESAEVELYIRNGCYHPMKWQVTSLQQTGEKDTFFCIGYKLIDGDRLEKFNTLLQKHYQLIMDGLTGIIFHDSRGELIAANKKTASLFHTSMERLYRIEDIRYSWETHWKIYNEEGDRVPFNDAPFIKAIETGKPQNEILLVKLRDGQNKWLLFNCQPLPDIDKNDNCAVITSVIDITQERQLAENVEEKNALIDAFVNQTPNLVWVLDEEGRVRMASAAFCDYFGIDRRSFLDKKMEDLVPPAIFKTFYDKHIQVFESGKPIQFVEKVKFADGRRFISHINIFPVKVTGARKLVGGHATNTPDTSRIESALREANDRLMILNQATTNAIWEWDMQTGNIFRNESLMQMIGYLPDTSKGLSWWLRRIHPDDRNRVSDKVKEATESYQHSWQDEYRFKCADGSYKHIQDKGFVIYENGLPVKMIGSLRDISEMKDLEQKLADERLQRQKEISETVTTVQEKERTRIGHELHDNVNQILSTTLLFVDMIDANGKDQQNLKSKSVEYLKNAIDEIRKLSKELVIPQFKKQGLVDSIQSLVTDMHMINAINIKFEHLANESLLSSGIKVTLFRIVQEQLKNILKHSRAKNASILLHITSHEVKLEIADDGIGFDARLTHQGIGLSNIFERVSMYNGQVDVTTSPGKGCMITITISLH